METNDTEGQINQIKAYFTGVIPSVGYDQSSSRYIKYGDELIPHPMFQLATGSLDAQVAFQDGVEQAHQKKVMLEGGQKSWFTLNTALYDSHNRAPKQ